MSLLISPAVSSNFWNVTMSLRNTRLMHFLWRQCSEMECPAFIPSMCSTFSHLTKLRFLSPKNNSLSSVAVVDEPLNCREFPAFQILAFSWLRQVPQIHQAFGDHSFILLGVYAFRPDNLGARLGNGLR